MIQDNTFVEAEEPTGGHGAGLEWGQRPRAEQRPAEQQPPRTPGSAADLPGRGKAAQEPRPNRAKCPCLASSHAPVQGNLNSTLRAVMALATLTTHNIDFP